MAARKKGDLAKDKEPEMSQAPPERHNSSTLPPDHRKRVSGRFRLDAESQQEIDSIIAEQRQAFELQKENENPQTITAGAHRYSEEYVLNFYAQRKDPDVRKYGIYILMQFELFNTLPICIRDAIESKLVGFLVENRKTLPSAPEMRHKIIEAVFDIDFTAMIKREIAKLLTDDSSDDRDRASQIKSAIVVWLSRKEVQKYIGTKE